jgi:hypothetical protein
MRVMETDHYSLLLPQEWTAEQEQSSVFISDRDGVGCLEITVLEREAGTFDAEAVRELADAPGALKALELAGRPAWGQDFEEEGVAIREWFLPSGRHLLYLTYSCELEHRGLDDAAVDELLGTLSLADAEP